MSTITLKKGSLKMNTSIAPVSAVTQSEYQRLTVRELAGA